MSIIIISELLLFGIFALYGGYILFFALMALKKTKEYQKETSEQNTKSFRSILVLIPAYDEDKVIMESVESFLVQTYPKEKYEICVISDHMKNETNQYLRTQPIRLEIADFKGSSTKVKALNLGMSVNKDYDIAVVMDADNVVEPDFLCQINNAFQNGSRIIQTHRTAKEVETPYQILDAISEEINNAIFRKGHSNAGLSAALIGSGMAFEYQTFKDILMNFQSIGGFDKELEHVFLRQGIPIDYLPDTYVYDEKIKQPGAFAKQRRRWISAQLFYLRKFAPGFFSALKEGNLDFCDKVFQSAMPPRLLLIGGVSAVALLETLLSPALVLKWWILWFLILLALLISIPGKFWNKKLFYAVLHMGQAFILMFITLFQLRGANRKFLHTKHGE